MKAERAKTEPEFVPVIVTLESQEEVDALFTIGNNIKICNALPVLDDVWDILHPFINKTNGLYDKFRDILK